MEFGLGERHRAQPRQGAEIEVGAGELDRFRSADAPDREHPLFGQYPEAWLESRLRAHLETVDTSLLHDPVYGQVPAFAAAERGVIDLLAADRAGCRPPRRNPAKSRRRSPPSAPGPRLLGPRQAAPRPRRVLAAICRRRPPPRSPALSAGLSHYRFSSHHRNRLELFLTYGRSAANRTGGKMAKGTARHVPPLRRAAALVVQPYDEHS